MQHYVIYAAYGWLTVTGLLHFFVDVVSQYLRGKRDPGPETTLYYGLNAAFSLGQVAFGLLGLLVAWQAMSLLTQKPAALLAVAAACGWFLIALLFMEYWEPRFNAGVFCLLIITAVVMR